MKKILGIDPGLSSGALAVVSRDDASAPIRFVEVIDVPLGESDDGTREVRASVLTFIQNHGPDAAYIERAQAMPAQGSSSGFNYGTAYGALRMAVRGCMVPLTRVESRAWKRAHGFETGADKEASRQRALALFPEAAAVLQRVGDHDRAEALLIAWYGMSLACGTIRAP